ncbi:MAG: hypothetical protein JWL70_258 [Acidimicrobiia bacterium]|nr:hypothetical protein [Acidimicrobiia bacterium]
MGSLSLMTESATVSLPGRRVVAIYGASLVVAVLVTGWVVTLVAQRGRAPRHVEVAGVELGGLSRPAVRAEVVKLAASLSTATVQIDAGSNQLKAPAAELGLSVQVDATVDEVMHAGRAVPVVGWPAAAFQSHKVAVSLAVDADKLANRLNLLEEANGRRPVEPSLTVKAGQLTAVAGQPGEALDPTDVVNAVREAGFHRGVIEVKVARRQRAPKHALAEAQQLAITGNNLTAKGLAVQAGGASTQLSAQQLRSWLRDDVAGPALLLAIDHDRAAYELPQLMAAGAHDPVNARFELQNGQPVVVPGIDGVRCCGPGAADAVFKGLQAPAATPVTLPVISTPPLITTAFAQQLGVKQKVSEFTTNHQPGEARVINIHRMADLMRGVVIPPGGTLSINGQVGPRTAAKGFVTATAIANGFDVQDVGGGVSQFATTLFNAAFFGGLDLESYQSHSLYISRYPFGREATMGFPAPDLKIHNPTKFGILVWPTYTDTSLTVSLYSTPYVAKVVQGPQVATLGGQSCIDVKTERDITYLDGTTKVDSVRARYRAMEGLNCQDPMPPGVKLQKVPGQPPLPQPPSAGTGVRPVAPPPEEN